MPTHPKVGTRIAILVLAVAFAACSRRTTTETDAGDQWAGTILTEGDVTTVVNASGSVWGGIGRPT